MYFCEDEQDIRYIDFINETKVYASKIPANFKDTQDSSSKFAAQKRPVHESVLLDEIKHIVKINRLRFEDYLADYDPLKKYFLPKNKFRGVISQMK